MERMKKHNEIEKQFIHPRTEQMICKKLNDRKSLLLHFLKYNRIERAKFLKLKKLKLEKNHLELLTIKLTI